MPDQPENQATQPEYLSVQDIMKILNVSKNTVYSRFSTYPGVIDIGKKVAPGERPYRVLRIPRGVLNRFLQEHRVR